MIEAFVSFLYLLVVLFIPGYFLSLAFFSSKKDLDLLERFVFSLVFSICFLPLTVLIENQVFKIPITFQNVWLSIAFLSLLGLVIYFIRIQKIPVPQQLYSLFPKTAKEDAESLIPKIPKLN